MICNPQDLREKMITNFELFIIVVDVCAIRLLGTRLVIVSNFYDCRGFVETPRSFLLYKILKLGFDSFQS